MTEKKLRPVSVYLLFCMFLVLFLSCSKKETAVPATKPADKEHTVDKLKGESIGKYTAGCIENPSKLERKGPGYQVIRLHRERYYGHPDTIRLIEDLGSEVKSKFGVVLYIADISKDNGGPILDNHSSHQTGLDADILYVKSPLSSNTFLNPDEREIKRPVSLLRSDGEAVDHTRWSPVNNDILRMAATNEKVDRIFVNPAIKRELCSNYPGEEWLRKIRPWWGHDGHFHVRLKCPENSPDCVPGSRIPDGAGCDSDLNWWFSREAKIRRMEIRQMPRRTEREIELPQRCRGILE